MSPGKQDLLRFGRGLLRADFGAGRPVALVTMPEPWQVARDLLEMVPRHIAFVESMDQEALATLERSIPREVGLVVGLGGGSSLDAAKYVAWRRGLPLVLIPSAVSVDACVTSAVAVRDAGRVRYIGQVVPECVLVDLDLVRRAPARLNRAGAADILSIHTALCDWKLAHEEFGEPFDPAIAEASRTLLAELDRAAEDIREVTDQGIRFLVQAFAAEDEICQRAGSSRPEEGSEHYFAYNVEYRTGRHFVHGELVALGVALVSDLQDNQPDFARSLLRRIGIDFAPASLGLSEADVVEGLLTLPEYVRSEGLPYSYADRAGVGPERLAQVVRHLEA